MTNIKCFMFGHAWTCNASEGIAPTKEQLDDPKRGFWEYAKTYCKRCGKQSELNMEKPND